MIVSKVINQRFKLTAVLSTLVCPDLIQGVQTSLSLISFNPFTMFPSFPIKIKCAYEYYYHCYICIICQNLLDNIIIHCIIEYDQHFMTQPRIYSLTNIWKLGYLRDVGDLGCRHLGKFETFILYTYMFKNQHRFFLFISFDLFLYSKSYIRIA